MSRRFVWSGLASLFLVLFLSACSDDDPTGPECPCADGVIEIPGEVATLAEAVAIASDGDSLVIAAGTYDGAVTVTRSLTIVGAAGSEERPVLSTVGGPLRFQLADGRVMLEDLVISGGEVGLDLHLDQSTVRAADCEILDTETGVAATGSLSNVQMRDMVFRDCGAGGGVEVLGEVVVSISHSRFVQDGGGGVAITVGEEGGVNLSSTDIEDHDAGDGAVIACTGEARIALGDVEFLRCAGDLVLSQGERVYLSRVEFDTCEGTMVRVNGYQQQIAIIDCRMHDCTGSFLQADDRQVVQMTYCSFIDNEGTLLRMGEYGSLHLTNCTVVGVAAGVLVDVAPFSETQLELCIVTEMATPVLKLPDDAGSYVLDIMACDLWSEGESAWVGLEEYLGVEGNIEADPLYCEPGDGDYQIELESPCVVDETQWMGAYLVGCG